MWARVMPTMSSLPLATAWRAVATSLMRAAWKTGNFVACFTSPTKSRWGAEAHAGDGDDLGQRRVMIDMAADDVEEIHLAGGDDAAADLQPLGLADALVPILVGHQARADDEVRPHGLAHGVEHAEGEAQAVIKGTAILVRALVGGRRPELVHQVAVAFEFDAIESGGLHALRRLRHTPG